MKEVGVILDMDGVIIDSEPVYRSLNQEIYNHLGISVAEHIQLEYVGATKWKKWEILKGHFLLQESIEELIDLQRDIFQQVVWDFKSLIFPEVVPFLTKLRVLHIPLALASSD